MDLIDIDDIEDALGRPPANAEEEAEWQFYITTLSNFINNYVDVSFFTVEGCTVRVRASYYGEIDLKRPVTEVTSVVDYSTQQNCYWAYFDGIDKIVGLYPEQVVDVTYSFGYSAVPEDVKSLMITGVLRQTGELSPINLRSYQVGDVREEYRDNELDALFGNLAATTLSKYSDDYFTIELGSGWYPGYNQPPLPVEVTVETECAHEPVFDTPVLLTISPTTALNTDVVVLALTGTDWEVGSTVEVNGVQVPAALNATGGTGTAYLSTSLVDQEVVVVNPDGQESNAITLPRTEPPTEEVTIWDELVGVPSAFSGGVYTIGTVFSSSVVGTVLSIRYWKADAGDTATDVRLYEIDGTLLASGTVTPVANGFIGWVTADLDTPVEINDEVQYVAAAVIPFGAPYSDAPGVLATSYENAPLTAYGPHPISSGAGGVYDITGDSFPESGGDGSSFYVDVVVEVPA